MAAIPSAEVTWDAVRIAQTRGLAGRQIASDLGIAHATLGKWVGMFSEQATAPAQDAALRRMGRLMRQNGIEGVRRRKFKVEGQKMKRGVIPPTPHRQRPHRQHCAESLGAVLASHNDPTAKQVAISAQHGAHFAAFTTTSRRRRLPRKGSQREDGCARFNA